MSLSTSLILSSRYVVLCCGCLLLAGLGAATQQALGDEPIWSDEFDGKSLDYSKWECEVNAFGGGNNELQLYTDRNENVRVEGGSLILEARKEPANISGTQRDFSSGRVRTKHRGDWKYGYMEVKAKLPRGQGIWPAIWMLPTEQKYGGWAAGGEVDIMEFKGHETSKVYGSLHFGDVWPRNRFTTGEFVLDVKREANASKSNDFSTDFHTFAIDWREGSIAWLVDGKEYQRLTKWDSVNGKFPAPFDQQFHLILNLAVGGGFPGNPDDATKFPQQFEVDYVRVYR